MTQQRIQQVASADLPVRLGSAFQVSRRRAIVTVPIMVLFSMVLASCAMVPAVTSEVRADLAPTGKLRAAINYGNATLATKDPSTGAPRGVAIDLAHELGRRLGVPVEFVVFNSASAMGDAAPAGKWDIAFLGSDPDREALMSFAPAYLEIEATYLVKDASPLRTAADVDRPGVRVAAPARGNYGLFLRRNLRHAQFVPVSRADAGFELLRADKVDAVGGLTQGLIDRAQQLPGTRIVAGRFMAVQQTIAVPKGRAAGLGYLHSLIEEAKTSGLVAGAIERTGFRGVSVAPAAK